MKLIKKKEVEVMEFSKKVLITSYVVGLFIIVFAMAIQTLFIVLGYEGSTEITVTLIGGAFGLMGIGNSFYSWKARTENSIKLEKLYGVKINNNDEENY